MDTVMEELLQVIAEQLAACTTSVHSLQIQNHIYGCFVLLEDCSENKITIKNGKIKMTNYTIVLDDMFGEIGIRYGFIMDTTLLCTAYLPEYKAAWMKILTSPLTVELVDAIEDRLIALIREHVPAKDGFFMAALKTGSLPQEWIHTVLTLLVPAKAAPNVPDAVEAVDHVVESSTATNAVDAQDEPISRKFMRRLHKTRRDTKVSSAFLGKTRRVKRVISH